jgi:signal transduction histidine kinase
MAEKAHKQARDDAENEKRRLEAVMETLPVGMSLVDERGNIMLCNSAYRKTWNGGRDAPIPARSFDDYSAYVGWWPDTGDRVQPHEWADSRAVQKGETVIRQLLEIKRFDGTLGFIIKSAAPIRDMSGKIIGAACVAQDITELRRIEDELREKEEKYCEISKSLKKTVREQVEKIRQAESLAARGRMVSVVAHEIRNPLLNILLGVDSLRGMVAGNADACEVLDEIDYGVNLLSSSVNDLLNYGRPIRLEKEITRISEVIADSLEEMRPHLTDIAVEIKPADEETELFVDKLRLEKALQNIIKNAAEAMPAGGKLEIRSKVSAENLILTISDTGKGMSEEEVANLFEPFYTTKVTGTGLGLAISRKIIEAHAGKISLKSKPGKGTTVRIILPLNR